MALTLKKVDSVELRNVGLDERWLQNQIQDDTSLLGLGELEIVSREHRQPVGGRIDFLMRNNDSDTYYEVEVMLGALDESHIIRSIEYWDIERQRRPEREHRAVIVAEQITSRFFNVLRLLNRSVPMIAVQLNAFQLNENEIVLHSVTVLDVRGKTEGDVDVDPVERADRPLWERKAIPSFLTVIDRIIASLRESGTEPRITYNRHHIAMGTTGYNFCWFHPRKLVGNCHVECRLTTETREEAVAELQTAGIDASPLRTENIQFILNLATLDTHLATVMNVLRRAEEASKR